MIYVASPYSHPDPVMRKTRYLLARDFVVHCVNTEGTMAFSPIVYGHELSVNYSVPTDHVFWLRFNLDILRRCEAMFVLQIDGWEESKGVKLEINVAKATQIPIVEFDANFNNLTAIKEKFGAQPSIILPQ